MLTDEQLLSRYKAGDDEAMASLIARYQQELFSFLCRFVSDRATAEDLFQETFIQIHRNAGSFDPERRFRPWLFTIAANKARDFLRAHGRRVAFSLDNTAGHGAGDSEQGSTFIDLMASAVEAPPAELSHAEDVARVSAALATMPALYREVLVLSYFHDFAYKDIADMLHIPLGTVKSRLHAAVAAFAKVYRGMSGEIKSESERS
ncbi:MAG TPA: sigma-70 family RNA polymerase sigma factor [Phycisphaerae bacterium]|nr:sigma-70 family RNA polymerase sigma factor [Phycisphaerae bacterium]